MSGANCEFARSKISPIGLTADGLWDLQCWGYDWGGLFETAHHFYGKRSAFVGGFSLERWIVDTC